MADLPPQFWQGVAEFQKGEYYACHDTLEALWIEAQEPDKTFFQGVLQIAVACYHLSQQNWRGAVILLGEGMYRLSTYQPHYSEIDVEYLLDTSAELLQYLQQLGPERVAEHRVAEYGVAQSSPDITVPQPVLRRLQ
jgi:uncharacterized protein